MATAAELFGADYLERARRYHRPRYWAFGLDAVLELGFLAVAAAGGLDGLVDGLPWWGKALAYAALVTLVGSLVRLPVSFWRGFLHERRFGFSTQTLGGWAADRAKAIAVSVVLSTLALFGLVALARAFPGGWPFAAAAAGAALVFLLTFLAPVVLEPIFNRFRPVDDVELAGELRRLSERAGVPVRDVLVADASRRTRKQNAYVSGLGATRRLVLWDTLLAAAERGPLQAVVAHELGHRRKRHLLQGTVLGMAAVAAAVAVFALVLGDGVADPRNVPEVMLLGAALELAATPLFAALSRRWEREADRFSLELTRDGASFERAQRELAEGNLSDVEPPRLVYALLFTHPTAVERIAAARAMMRA